MIVWDSGTWQPYGDPAEPAEAVAGGELHAELHGTKLRGMFVLVRTSRESSDREQWLLLHKRDQFAVDGLGPRRPSALGVVRTDQRRGRRRSRAAVALGPAGRPCRRSPVPGRESSGPSADELAELDALATAGHWHVFGATLRVTNLDKVLFPARGRRAADRQTRVPALLRPDRADARAIPHRPAAEHAPIPRTGRTAAASGTRSSRRTLRTGSPGGTTRPPRPTRRVRTSWSTNRPRWSGRRTSARSSGTRGPPQSTGRTAVLRADRHRSGRGDQLGRRADPGPAAPDGLRAPRAFRASRR